MVSYSVAHVRVYDSRAEQELTGLYVSEDTEDAPSPELRGYYDLQEQAEGGAEDRGADWVIDDVCLGVAFIIECASPGGPERARELINDESQTTESILSESPATESKQEMKEYVDNSLERYRR